MPHRIAKTIYNEIIKADKILLVCHQNPDGDALGSVSALGYFLNGINKIYNNFCLTKPSHKLNSLPHLMSLSADPQIWEQKHDLIIVLDSGDLDYAGVAKYINKLNHDPIIVNIDHHASNNRFGQHNLVITTASATTEILYQFFKYNNIIINKNMAVALLTGLITDTENFSNPGTTINSLKIASELIHQGANFNLVKTWFIRDKSISALKLWGSALSRLTKHKTLDIIYTYITHQDIIEHGVSDIESEGIANYLNNLNEGRAALILKEMPNGKIKGSFRTTHNDVDVSQMAQALGGGGHKKASGFTLDGTIETAFEQIWSTLAKV